MLVLSASYYLSIFRRGCLYISYAGLNPAKLPASQLASCVFRALLRLLFRLRMVLLSPEQRQLGGERPREWSGAHRASIVPVPSQAWAELRAELRVYLEAGRLPVL